MPLLEAKGGELTPRARVPRVRTDAVAYRSLTSGANEHAVVRGSAQAQCVAALKGWLADAACLCAAAGAAASGIGPKGWSATGAAATMAAG